MVKKTALLAAILLVLVDASILTTDPQIILRRNSQDALWDSASLDLHRRGVAPSRQKGQGQQQQQQQQQQQSQSQQRQRQQSQPKPQTRASSSRQQQPQPFTVFKSPIGGGTYDWQTRSRDPGHIPPLSAQTRPVSVAASIAKSRSADTAPRGMSRSQIERLASTLPNSLPSSPMRPPAQRPFARGRPGERGAGDVEMKDFSKKPPPAAGPSQASSSQPNRSPRTFQRPWSQAKSVKWTSTKLDGERSGNPSSSRQAPATAQQGPSTSRGSRIAQTELQTPKKQMLESIDRADGPVSPPDTFPRRGSLATSSSRQSGSQTPRNQKLISKDGSEGPNLSPYPKTPARQRILDSDFSSVGPSLSPPNPALISTVKSKSPLSSLGSSPRSPISQRGSATNRVTPQSTPRRRLPWVETSSHYALTGTNLARLSDSSNENVVPAGPSRYDPFGRSSSGRSSSGSSLGTDTAGSESRPERLVPMGSVLLNSRLLHSSASSGEISGLMGRPNSGVLMTSDMSAGARTPPELLNRLGSGSGSGSSPSRAPSDILLSTGDIRGAAQRSAGQGSASQRPAGGADLLPTQASDLVGSAATIRRGSSADSLAGSFAGSEKSAKTKIARTQSAR